MKLSIEIKLVFTEISDKANEPRGILLIIPERSIDHLEVKEIVAKIESVAEQMDAILRAGH